MRKIRNPDFFHTYRNILPSIYALSPKTHRVITANAAILNTPGKDTELLSPLVWLYEKNAAQITSDIKKVIEFDLIYSCLLTYTLANEQLAKAIFDIASTLRTANALTIENLHHIIQFPSIDNPQYYPEDDDEKSIENFNAFSFTLDVSNHLSTTAHSYLIDCSHILSFAYQHDLIKDDNFTKMTAFISENSGILNNINQLLENIVGASEEDCLKILFKIDFIKTGELRLIKKIFNNLKNYGELSSDKIDFLFSSIQEKINLNQAQEIKPFLENTLTNILNLTFFGINADARVQLISNLDALDDLFYAGLTLSELLLFDADTRQILLDNISEDNVHIIRFFINRQEISPFLFFSSYASKGILKQLSQITIELDILGELNHERLEQLFKNIFNDNTTPSDIKKFFSDQLSTQFDSIINYDFFDLSDDIIFQLRSNHFLMQLIWKTGISLTKFVSLDEALRENAIADITHRNTIIVRFFSKQGVPVELFFGAETLSTINEIALILMQDNANGIASEQLEELYFKFRKYFLVSRRRQTVDSIGDFFQMHLESLENPAEKMPVASLSENRAGFFSATRSPSQSDSDNDGDRSSSSPH